MRPVVEAAKPEYYGVGATYVLEYCVSASDVACLVAPRKHWLSNVVSNQLFQE